MRSAGKERGAMTRVALMSALRIPGAMRGHDGRNAGSLHAGELKFLFRHPRRSNYLCARPLDARTTLVANPLVDARTSGQFKCNDRQIFFQTTTTMLFKSGSNSTNVEDVPNEFRPLRWAASLLLLLASSPSAAAPSVLPFAAPPPRAPRAQPQLPQTTRRVLREAPLTSKLSEYQNLSSIGSRTVGYGLVKNSIADFF
ncbi:hypothetical protein EVAR_54879_1 [Eumeta japonica]|uniref:Uncharacterized protein n=1 Tax=Eumeta variegata TaxID=151549 RepID=A0A4C1YHB3_EUMVA|nr:hypothetical protein EVAR_54879_1 [Eumeta japonica]